MSHTPSRCLFGTLLAIGRHILFQSFVMGADALAELDSPLAEVDPGLQRTGRQFSFNDLNFEGFQGGATSQQSPFQSFPQFTSPASTSTTFARARQPIPSRCQPFNINQTQKMNKDTFSECKLLSHLFKALPYHVVVESARRQTRTLGFPLKRSNPQPASSVVFFIFLTLLLFVVKICPPPSADPRFPVERK